MLTRLSVLWALVRKEPCARCRARYRTEEVRGVKRYLHSWRMAGLAGAVTLAAFAANVAPAGATVTCPGGTTVPQYCITKIKLSVKLSIKGGRVTVKVKVSDPQVTITLLRNGSQVKQLL